MHDKSNGGPTNLLPEAAFLKIIAGQCPAEIGLSARRVAIAIEQDRSPDRADLARVLVYLLRTEMRRLSATPKKPKSERMTRAPVEELPKKKDRPTSIAVAQRPISTAFTQKIEEQETEREETAGVDPIRRRLRESPRRVTSTSTGRRIVLGDITYGKGRNR